MCERINGDTGDKKGLISECLLVKKPPAPPKVTPLHAAAVRSQVIYNSSRGGVGG